MEKYAWKAKIVDGAIDEYVRRHDALWDEMKRVLSEAGIVNYTIWNVGDELFGYYECEKGIAYAANAQALVYNGETLRYDVNLGLKIDVLDKGFVRLKRKRMRRNAFHITWIVKRTPTYGKNYSPRGI